MAAYAAVISLMGTIHQFSQSNLYLQAEEGHKENLKLLYNKVGCLRELLDNSSTDEPTKDLQEKIKYLAHEVEDQVELQVGLLVLEDDEHVRTKANEKLLRILQQAIQDVDPVTEELSKQWNNSHLQQAVDPSLGGFTSQRSHDDYSTLENEMVGYNIEQEHILGQLTGHSSQLEVISIAGMGGIGKSTFANKMFSDPSIVRFFDIRGWITVSKDYSLRKMLISLLEHAIGVKAEELDGVDDGDLADRLQKKLKGRRYLIVVDDIWSTEAWDEIGLWFPEYSNRSRVLLTTRDMKVAQYVSFPKDPFPMRFLEPEESWSLFCQKAFDKKVCPIEFEKIAKEVVENCKGLPLMISVVAGTLSSKGTLHEWRNVAQSISSLVNLDDYQHCSGVLALSYNHLPSHLKALFLYFGVFPKASEISVKKLIRLWISEGLLELKELEGLEKVAGNLLHDLIDKSLVVVSKLSLDGKLKTCRIHDLLHDVCLRESENENLLYVVNPPKVCPQGRRWVPVHCFSPIRFDDLTYSKTRSIIHYSSIETGPRNLGLHHFKLLRVLDLGTVRLTGFPSELVQIVSLRYLDVKVSECYEYPHISNLWKLQTFILYKNQFDHTILPNEIWEMSQLRHLHSNGMHLDSPPKVSAEEVKCQVLENLQSVSGLSPRSCTKETFEGMKKVKRLGIVGNNEDFYTDWRCLENVIYLQELEALHIKSSYDYKPSCVRFPALDSFPPNLKKLTLYHTRLPWKNMTMISQLPKLEVLQLKLQAFTDDTEYYRTNVWEVTNMVFPALKVLLLEDLFDLVCWRATDDYFPCLERIIIRDCSKLQEIPKGFADSLTLQRIELYECCSSLVNCAERIQKEQLENLGSNMLKVHVFDTI